MLEPFAGQVKWALVERGLVRVARNMDVFLNETDDSMAMLGYILVTKRTYGLE